MWLANHPRRLQRAVLRRAALEYARRGWAVTPGACLVGERFICERLGCPTTGSHPAFENWEDIATATADQVAAWWHRQAFSVLLPTGRAFDVIEVPTQLGEAALRTATARTLACPVAVGPTGRWMFFVRTGEGVRPELLVRLDVIVHSRGSWVPAPPTVYPQGRVRWLVSPAAGGWRLPDPYRVQAALVAAESSRVAVLG